MDKTFWDHSLGISMIWSQLLLESSLQLHVLIYSDVLFFICCCCVFFLTGTGGMVIINFIWSNRGNLLNLLWKVTSFLFFHFLQLPSFWKMTISSVVLACQADSKQRRWSFTGATAMALQALSTASMAGASLWRWENWKLQVVKGSCAWSLSISEMLCPYS